MRAAPAGLLVLFLAASAHAQTLGEHVGEHVGEHLKTKKKKKKKAPSHSRPRPAPVWHPAPRPAEPPKTEDKPKGPQLPYRVFVPDFQLDPEFSVAYRGWRPQDYPSMDVETENAATFSVGVRAKLFRIINVHRAYYESNAVSSPRRKGASIAVKTASTAPAAAWLLGAIGIDVNWVLEPIIRYEARAFESELTPKRPIRIIPHSADKNADLSTFPLTTETLRMTSAFETLIFGLRYHHDNDPSGIISTSGGTLPPIYFGVGLVSYSKPYMVRVGDFVLDDLVFDARLKGAGLALGGELPMKPDHFFASLSTQLGVGQVDLTHNFTLNETVPDGWLIGYAQGELSGGYLYPILRTRPTLLAGIEASVGGATFFYFKALSSSDEERQTPPLNWDLLWGARVFLTLPL